LDDLTLDFGTDARVKQNRAIKALNQASKKVWSALRADGVDPMTWKQEVALTVDANDSDRYPLPPRTRQVILTQDDTTQFRPAGTFKTGAAGYVVEEGCRAIRIRNLTIVGTYDAWIVQEPVNVSMSALAGASGSTDTITLEASPSVGSTVIEDDYYNGAQIAITSGTGVGQIRTISDYAGSTRVATLSTDWTTPPTVSGSSVYSILTDIPGAAVNAQVLRAAMQIVRSDEVMKEFYADLREDYLAAYRDGYMLIHTQNLTKVDTPVLITHLRDSNTGEYT
jgi:hypothetical protein